MRLLRFRSEGLNGYLEFDLDLSNNLSFLIGINGSGKTSVLRSIMALLGPDLSWLSSATYSNISLDVELEGELVQISAANFEGVAVVRFRRDDVDVSCSISAELIAKHTRMGEEFAFDDEGQPIVLRENRIDIPSNIPTLMFIKDIPTPIFLGLDRTTLGSTRDPNRRATRSRRPHATLRTFLDESVSQAERLAVFAARSANLERTRRAARLREAILLSLFSELKADNYSDLPRKSDLRRLEQTRKSLKAAFSILGIPERNASRVIDPFFSDLFGLVNKLSKFSSNDQIFKEKDIASTGYIDWLNATPRLTLISSVENMVQAFNREELEVFYSIRRYEGIMNDFLGDSKKHLSFSDDGDLQISLPSDAEGTVHYLSSGERQLFVLITNLMFNNDNKQANVVIIDEPELSLHMKWQEMFVSSLQSANPQTQLILATHSPSIINSNEEFCVDLS
ncbi:AAA family ATPase [Brevundimonas sp.]|uniref:AAA family ATPase n=1 Tax=Brevundimonas sp. TaxID=1871086 RepID=UPI003BAD8744